MKKESIHAYPAVFEKDEAGLYGVSFPDIPGCFTCGDNLTDALVMASDVLALMVYTNYEEKNIQAPEPTPIKEIKLRENEFASYVVGDTKYYRRKFGSKAVKKTLTIPEWLNNAATEKKINFSKVLQDALQKELNELPEKPTTAILFDQYNTSRHGNANACILGSSDISVK